MTKELPEPENEIIPTWKTYRIFINVNVYRNIVSVIASNGMYKNSRSVSSVE